MAGPNLAPFRSRGPSTPSRIDTSIEFGEPYRVPVRVGRPVDTRNQVGGEFQPLRDRQPDRLRKQVSDGSAMQRKP